MTFDAAIPLAGNSPGIFPAQSQTNFQRLQAIIDADHQFNNTAAANDGYHNLIHMTTQAPTGLLASTGRLYVKVVAGAVNLLYMDDLGTEYLITPQYLVTPIRITATVNLNDGQIYKIPSLVNPAYDYTANSTLYINNTLLTNSAVLLKTGTFASPIIYSSTATNFSVFYAIDDAFPPGPGNPPTTLYILNSTGNSQDFVLSIMLNRTT